MRGPDRLQDAVNNRYVDEVADSCLRNGGGQMTGDLDMNNRFMRGLPTY